METAERQSTPTTSRNTLDDCPGWAALILLVPELDALVEEVRGYLDICRSPETIWYCKPAGVRLRITEILHDAELAGVALPPDAEVIAIDRLLAEVLCGPSSLERWGNLH